MAVTKTSIESADQKLVDEIEKIIDKTLTIKWTGKGYVSIDAWDIQAASGREIKEEQVNKKLLERVATRYKSDWKVEVFDRSLRFS